MVQTSENVSDESHRSHLRILVLSSVALSRSINNDKNVTEFNLSTIQESLPFPTTKDFENLGQYTLIQQVPSSEIKFEFDWLAPKIIYLKEHSTIVLDDGTKDSISLLIDYYETASELIAKQLTSELLYEATHSPKYYQFIDLPPLDVDSSSAYTIKQSPFCTILVIRKNHKVMRIDFDKIEGSDLTINEWSKIFANSIQ